MHTNATDSVTLETMPLLDELESVATRLESFPAHICPAQALAEGAGRCRLVTDTAQARRGGITPCGASNTDSGMRSMRMTDA